MKAGMLGVAVLVVALSYVEGASAAPPEAFTKLGCAACHGVDNKIIGPAMKEVAAKYKDNKDATAQLTSSIKQGGSGKWGPIPMPPQPNASDADVASLVDWLAKGAP